MKKIVRSALVLAVSAGMVLGATPAANALSSGGFTTGVTGVTGPVKIVEYGNTSNSEAVEQELISLINQHRVNNGVAPVEVSVSLMDSAKNWSNTMAQSNRLYHSGQNVDENIIRGTHKHNSLDLFESWKNSPGHNRNMLNPRHKTFGVGVSYDARGQIWATTQFYIL